MNIDRREDEPLSMKSEEKSLFTFFLLFAHRGVNYPLLIKIMCGVGKPGRLEKYLERWKRMQNQFKKDKKLFRRVKQIRQWAISQ